MKKLFFSLGLSLLFLTSVGLLKPQSVLAAEGGPSGKFMLKAASGPRAGEVTLVWSNNDTVDNYHLVYGTDSKNMQYGTLNIGTSKVYTVKMLNPGTKYYFALVPVLNNRALYTSEWVSAWAKSGQVTSVAPVTSVKPVTSVTPVVKPTTSAIGKHWLVAGIGPKEGEVTLNWRHMDDANNYHLVYGTQPGKYSYGALNIGWVNSFTVRNLVPGKTYYFALVPVKNNVALYTTDQVMTAAKMNIQVVQTTADVLMQTVQSITSSGAQPSIDSTPSSAIPSTDSAFPTTPAGN